MASNSKLTCIAADDCFQSLHAKHLSCARRYLKLINDNCVCSRPKVWCYSLFRQHSQKVSFCCPRMTQCCGQAASRELPLQGRNPHWLYRRAQIASRCTTFTAHQALCCCMISQYLFRCPFWMPSIVWWDKCWVSTRPSPPKWPSQETTAVFNAEGTTWAA